MNCNKCGKEIASGASFCEYCGAPVTAVPPVVQAEQPLTPDQIPAMDQGKVWSPAPSAPGKKENVLLGLIGALVGAAIGGAAMILISQMGYVASISGIIMAFCTLKGYELLGGKLSTKGIVICIVLMLIAPFVADTIDWAIVIMNSYDGQVSFVDAITLLPMFLEEGAIDSGVYVQSLLMLYGFTALGAVGIVVNTIKSKK